MRDDVPGLLWEGLRQTLYMTAWSSLFALLLGTLLGITLVVTEKGGILAAPAVNRVIATVINGVRSVPFIILIVLLLPLSRLIVGTTLGPTGAFILGKQTACKIAVLLNRI
ncbi:MULTISPECIES: hypothetical protein [Paenibacillus]|uniref:hypothetical protein n=1 Tax=Paenibacillus TaxID=44249 RepID=UPI001F21DB28|nr:MULTISPECIES: hypothetical protein [Paenibacillus]